MAEAGAARGPVDRVRRVAETALDSVAAYALWGGVALHSRLPGARARNDGTPHALLLAHALPPAITGGVYRPTSWLRYAERNGWAIGAVSYDGGETPSEAGLSLLGTIPPGVTMDRFGKPSLRPSWSFFPRVDGGFVNVLGMYDAAVRRRAGRGAPTVIVASGPPFYAFVAGLFAARHYGAPLVLDYRDEWTECPFDFVQATGSDRAWEERCQKAAAAVIFTTRSFLDHHLATFPSLDAARCHVVANGYDAPDGPPVAAAPPPARGGLTLSFLGALDSHCPPGPFLDCLEKVLGGTCGGALGPLRLQFVGRRSEAADAELSRFSRQDMLDLKDQVPLPAAQALMRESGALLILSRAELSRYRPGKLYEYIAARRPILVYGHEGESSALVRELGAGVFVREGDVEGLRYALAALAGGALEADAARRVDEWLRQHSREAMAGRFFDVLNGVAACAPAHPACGAAA